MNNYGIERLLRLAMPSRQAPAMAGSPAIQPVERQPYDYNTMRPPESLPYNERFSGGALQSTYTPYQGDHKTYGQRAQHRFYTPPIEKWSTATSTSTATASGTGTDTSEYNNQPNQGGGSDQGAGHGDLEQGRGQAQDPAMKDVVRDALAMWDSTPGLAMLGRGAMAVGRDIFGRDAPGVGQTGFSGMSEDSRSGVGSPSSMQGSFNEFGDIAAAAAASGSGDWDGSQAGLEGASMEAAAIDAMSGNSSGPSQAFAKGGIVKGDRRLGKDDVTIRADGGEGIIRAVEMKKLGADFLKRLNSGRFDVRALRKAAGLK